MKKAHTLLANTTHLKYSKPRLSTLECLLNIEILRNKDCYIHQVEMNIHLFTIMSRTSETVLNEKRLQQIILCINRKKKYILKLETYTQIVNTIQSCYVTKSIYAGLFSTV